MQALLLIIPRRATAPTLPGPPVAPRRKEIFIIAGIGHNHFSLFMACRLRLPLALYCPVCAKDRSVVRFLILYRRHRYYYFSKMYGRGWERER